MKSNAKPHILLFKQTSGEINTKFTQTLEFTHLHKIPQKTQKNFIAIFSQNLTLHLQIEFTKSTQKPIKAIIFNTWRCWRCLPYPQPHQSHNFQHLAMPAYAFKNYRVAPHERGVLPPSRARYYYLALALLKLFF